jgi:DnaK suppressor protein
MSTRFVSKQIRERLEARRRSLLSRYESAIGRPSEGDATPGHHRVDEPETWDHVLTRMTAVDLRTLESVVRAIRRLDTGTYGICASCDERIEPARLAALPEAAECVDCVRFADETPPQWTVSVAGGGTRRAARPASEPSA